MGKINILLVEDETIIGLSIRQKLESLGYHVILIVSSGDEAYQVSAEKAPDLVVMDIHLDGDLDGIETAETLWNHFSIPIVCITGSIDPKIRDCLHRDWCYGFVAKPFQGNELESAVSVALNRIFTERFTKIHSPQFLENIYHPIRELNKTDPKFFASLGSQDEILGDQDRLHCLDLFEVLSVDHEGELVVDMKEFISHITYYTWSKNYAQREVSVDLSLECDSVVLSDRFALPLSLVVSEAVANSMKHGFPKDNVDHVIEVRFGWSKHKDRLNLKIRDNGIGLPQPQGNSHSLGMHEPDTSRSRGLGLKIAEGMARLLGGEYFLNGDQGTILEVNFPYSNQTV